MILGIYIIISSASWLYWNNITGIHRLFYYDIQQGGMFCLPANQNGGQANHFMICWLPIYVNSFWGPLHWNLICEKTENMRYLIWQHQWDKQCLVSRLIPRTKCYLEPVLQKMKRHHVNKFEENGGFICIMYVYNLCV